MIEFGNSKMINKETLSNGIFKIDRNNSIANIWNPFVMNYIINDAQSPIHIKKSNDSFVLKLISKSTRVNDLRVYIRIQDLRSRVRLSLMPNNLSHTAKYEDESKIIWTIDYPRYGSNYILSFTELHSNFSILSVEASYLILDELCSGLFVKNIILTKDDLRKTPAQFIKRSKIIEKFTL